MVRRMGRLLGRAIDCLALAWAIALLVAAFALDGMGDLDDFLADLETPE